MKQNSLNGKVAVITGATSGIGKAIAFRYASEGAKVVIASRNIVTCEAVVNELREKEYDAIAIACDVRNEKDIINLFDMAEKEYGRIDIVVVSAGISGGNKMVEEYSLEHWNSVIETNLTGAFLTVREAFKKMKRFGGHILLLSSQAGVEGYAGKGVYCASKFGVRGLAHALGEEGRKYNINVTAICPGTVDTPILAATNTNVANPMTTEAVADAAVYLACLRGNSLVRELLLERMNTN